MKKRKALIGCALAVVMAVTTLAGCESQKETEEAAATTSDSQSAVEIINSYDNTDELLEDFPVINPTPVETDLEKDIQNRLLTGFANWNMGYDAWEKWGDILYTDDSYYNVHGVRLTLGEYQMAMDMSLKATDIQMGNFNNMVISDDWAAIRYDITNTDRQTNSSDDATVIKFVNFKDYGEDLGVRVVEGWAGTIGSDFDAMSKMQTEEERAAEQAELGKILNTIIPDTSDLNVKYPVNNPTPIETDEAKKIKAAILEDFDSWNQGYDTWVEQSGNFYDDELQYHVEDEILTLAEYQEKVKNDSTTADVKRISFNNLLVSGDWAAIYYNTRSTDVASGEKEVKTVMQFLHFEQDGNNLKVTECWTKN